LTYLIAGLGILMVYEDGFVVRLILVDFADVLTVEGSG
jgi:hypothetical protein